MTVTFGQAKRSLTRFLGASGHADPAAAINAACEELSFSEQWRDLRKTVRLAVYGGSFALPQEYENLLRACVEGRSVPIYGPDIEFLSSGPGDFDFIPNNRAPINGIQDNGRFPTMYPADLGSALAFFSVTVPALKVTVRGRDESGDRIVESVAVNGWTSPADITGMAVSEPVQTAAKFAIVDSIVLPDDATAYISCYGITSAFKFLARMHPAEKVPQFRRYRIPGPNASAPADYAYNVLAEVRLRYVPLVSDSDPMPFDSLLPVQYMLRALSRADADDLDGSNKFRAQAVAALAMRENVREERSGVVVINAMFEGSPGQVSTDLYNI